MESAQYIEIVFENCESIIIPIERIAHLGLGELHKFEDDPFGRNQVYESEFLDLKIKLYNQSDTKYPLYPSDEEEPLGMFVGNPTSNNVRDRPNILGRMINYKDIVDVQFLDKDENVLKDIYVPWSESNNFNNDFMTTKISDGLLEVLIKK